MPIVSNAGNEETRVGKIEIKGVTMATSYGSPPPGTLNSQWRVGILTCVKGPTMNQEVGWRRQTKDKATKLCKAKPQGQKLLSNGTTQGSKFIFGFGSTCATRCKYLGALPKF